MVVSDQERLARLASIAAKFQYCELACAGAASCRLLRFARIDALGVIQVSHQAPRTYRIYHTLGVFESGPVPNAAPIPKAAINEEAFLASFAQCGMNVKHVLPGFSISATSPRKHPSCSHPSGRIPKHHSH